MTTRAAQTHNWFVTLDNGQTKTGSASSLELATKACNAFVSRCTKAAKRWPKDCCKVLDHGVSAL
jgi:hypothetical protein